MLQQARQKIRESSGETAKVPVIPLNQGTVAAKPPRKQTIIEKQPSVEMVDDDDDGEGGDGADEELLYEDEEIDENPGQVEVKTTIKPKEDNKPVILTSNFFLPGKPVPHLTQKNDFDNEEPNDLSSDIAEINDRDKDNAEDVIDSRPDEQTEKIVEEQTTKKLMTEPSPTKVTSTAASTTKVKHPTEDPNVEYEYEYVDYDETTTTTTTTTTESKSDPTRTVDELEREHEHEHTTLNSFEHDTHESTEEVPEVTTKSDFKTDNKSMKSSTSMSTSSSTSLSTSTSSSAEQIEASIEPAETTPVSTTETAENNVDSTEGYMVVASVQTSRSISGARFLTIPSFPTVEEEERRQLLGETKNQKQTKGKDEDYSGERHANDTHKDDDDLVRPNESESQSTEKDDESTESSDENVPQSTVHPETSKASKPHKLSTISEKLAHLHELNEPKPDITTTSLPVVIRKFSPRTTKAPTRKTTKTTSKKPSTDMDDELASLLPPGFKYRANSIKETTITTSSTTPRTAFTIQSERDVAKNDNKNAGNAAKDAAVEIGGKTIQFKEILIDDLLPKDYKPTVADTSNTSSNDSGKSKAANLTKMTNEPINQLSKIKSDDGSAEAVLHKTTKAPFQLSTVTEDISKLLPPGFKLPKESSTTKRPLSKTTMDDISKFLPPGFKLPKYATTEMPSTKPDNDNANIEKSVLNKLSFNVDISSLLPPAFKSNATPHDTASDQKVDAHEKSTPNNSTTSNSSFKLVFPKGIGKRPGVRLTTARPLHAGGPAPPEITIRKGLPTR